MPDADKRLAIFDFDGTIIHGQSQLYLINHALLSGMIGLLVYIKILAWFWLYKANLVHSPERIVLFAYRKILEGRRVDELELVLEQFCAKHIYTRFRSAIVEEINQRLASDEVVIVSNALEPLVKIVAAKLGVSRVIATRPQAIDGVYTGSLEGEIVYGSNKSIAILREYTIDQLSGATAFADHHSDLPLFEKVARRVAVGPDRKLMKIALSNNWRIIR